TGNTGNNITGFTAIATGTYSTATGLSGDLTDTYFWSGTKAYDALVRSDVLGTLRITATGKNIVASAASFNGHSLQFGHAIRCVRK
ncbi:MAG: hypothetical protein K2M98_03625, partial [Muribaculum sp.]|nr:hypothetical protein [Muribaculum sp.]